jgi:hypothetical protein
LQRQSALNGSVARITCFADFPKPWRGAPSPARRITIGNVQQHQVWLMAHAVVRGGDDILRGGEGPFVGNLPLGAIEVPPEISATAELWFIGHDNLGTPRLPPQPAGNAALTTSTSQCMDVFVCRDRAPRGLAQASSLRMIGSYTASRSAGAT